MYSVFLEIGPAVQYPSCDVQKKKGNKKKDEKKKKKQNDNDGCPRIWQSAEN